MGVVFLSPASKKESKVSLQQRKVLRVLSSAQILSGMGVSGTFAAGSLLVSQISNSETLAGLAQTTSVLGAAAMALPLARLTQRGGRRLALSTGYSIGAIGALFAIFGGSQKILFIMLMGTFLVGAASASAYQARFAAIDLATNESRSKNLSFVVWASTVGAVTGPNLMAPSGHIATALGLPKLVGPYLIASVTLTLATIVIRLFLKPDPYLTANIASDGVTQKKHESTRMVLIHIRSNPKSLFAIATIAVGHLVMVSIMSMTPVHMAHVKVQLSIIGIVISVHVLGMYAFSPLVGWLTDQIGHIKVIQIGVVLLLLAAVVSGSAEAMDAVRLGIGLFLLGLGWSCTLIAGSTYLSESVSVEMKPASQGASDLVMNLTGALGGALSGVIIGTIGYGWLCTFAVVPVVILAFWSLKISSLTVK